MPRLRDANGRFMANPGVPTLGPAVGPDTIMGALGSLALGSVLSRISGGYNPSIPTEVATPGHRITDGRGGGGRTLYRSRRLGGYKRRRRRTVRGKYKKLKSRMKRSSKKAFRRRGRKSGGGKGNGNASLGNKAIIGKVDEEDAAVKRHMKKGIVVEYGSSGVINGNHGGGIVHGTVPELIFLRTTILSLLKTLMCHSGYELKDPNDPLTIVGGSSDLTFFMEYFYYLNSNELQQGQISAGSVTVDAGHTWYMLAQDMATQILAIPAATAQGIAKWGKMWFADTLSPATWYGSIDLDVCKINIDCVSNLVYQNRSVSQEASGSTNNAFDVAQDPLFEVHLNGKGSGPITVEAPMYGGATTTTAENFFIDYLTGVNARDFGTNTYLMAEPSKGGFLNARTGLNTSANPGVVKQSKLKTHLTFTFTKLFPYFRFFGLTNYNYNKVSIGKYRYLWFRKTIDLATGDTQEYKIAYHHHWAGGVTTFYRSNNKTVPFVARIR